MNDRLPRLRGHHLICLQFFHGEGCGPVYARTLFDVIGRLSRHGGIIVTGPDDLCLACPSLVDGRCSKDPQGEDEVRILDTLALELLGLSPNERFDYGETSVWVTRIIDRWRTLACDGCRWEDRCAPMIARVSRFPTDR